MAGESFFETVVENESLLTDSFSGTYLATDHTTSPWHPDYQHGGPASALLARAIGMLEMPIDDPVINRVTVDIMAPIPKGAIAISARVVKAGRLTTLVEADLSTAAHPRPRTVPVPAARWNAGPSPPALGQRVSRCGRVAKRQRRS